MVPFDATLQRGAEEHLAQIDGKERELLQAAPVAIAVVGRGDRMFFLKPMAESCSDTSTTNSRFKI